MSRIAVIAASMFAIAQTASATEQCVVSASARALIADVEREMNRPRTSPETGAIYRLVTDRSSSGDEALAALIGFYLGESTEPECEALSRGRRMVKHLRRFDACTLSVELKPSQTHSRKETMSLIEKGKKCG